MHQPKFCNFLIVVATLYYTSTSTEDERLAISFDGSGTWSLRPTAPPGAYNRSEWLYSLVLNGEWVDY